MYVEIDIYLYTHDMCTHIIKSSSGSAFSKAPQILQVSPKDLLNSHEHFHYSVSLSSSLLLLIVSCL